MNYAVIAAGDGSRLAKEGVVAPKPLVELNGEKMIDRLIRIFLKNHADSISIIVNEYMTEVETYLREKHLPVPFHLIVKTTPSSMHSFYELSKILPHGKFCLTTVDTIFREEEFSRYIDTFESETDADGLFAVTDFIEDESPLYVDVTQDLFIKGFHDNDYPGSKYISGGIYCLSSSVFPVLEGAVSANRSRMRNFQRELVEKGVKLKAFPFKKIIDVDHASDIQIAEALLKE
ncbi:MAG: NTP transferase domain-containing protein [Bacteroidales bacterium]